MQLPSERYDVAVIGAGVVGCAIAMELSRYAIRTILIEARSDIGAATSKANSAILHTGFDAVPASLESELVRQGYRRFHEYSESLGLPIGRLGALVVAWDRRQADVLPDIIRKAEQNGVSDLRLIDRDELRSLEPHLAAEASQAVLVPGESITCPFTPPLAFATNAVRNGVTLRKNFRIRSVDRVSGGIELRSETGRVSADIVVNAAGLWSDEIDRLFGKTTFSIHPRKGEFIVFDKPASHLINHIVLPVPTKRTKGVLLARTAFGNLLLGPTAVDVEDKGDTSVSAESIRSLLDAGYRMLPALEKEEVTCTYAGLRAATEHQDYQINFYPSERYVTVGGIRSTGLSSSLGIAGYVLRSLLSKFEMPPALKDDWKPHRMPPITDLDKRVCEDPVRIAEQPSYGSIICHCEHVSKGEILDALRAPIPACDLDSLKRRTRATLGRCQGFNCYARLVSMIQAHAEN
jgi:glycerol-3-phosphate dehydrogenase